MTEANYMRRYRQTASGQAQLERQRKAAKARAAALRRLADKYPHEFSVLLSHERHKAGL